MNVRKLVVASALALILSGCKTVEMVYVPTPVPIAHPPAPPVAQIDDVQWQVWNKAAAQQAGSSPGEDRVWYVLEPDQFERLMKDISAIGNFIEKQSNSLQYYRQAIDAHNKNVRRAQAEAEETKSRR